MSTDLMVQLENILQNEVANRHSFFQLNNFIVNSEYTIQGKIWQVLKELRSRKESIDAFKNDLEEASDNSKLLKIQIKRLKDAESNLSDLDKKENCINIKKLRRKYKNLNISIDKIKQNVKYIQEEVSFLISAFNSLTAIEPVKSFDDVVAQKEYWNAKLGQELNLNILLGKVPVDLIKTILHLHDEAPIKKQVIKMLNDKLSPENKLIKENNG